jgi:hypothetical protein
MVRAYRPNTYFAMVAAAAATGREFKFGGAEIIPFEAERAAH